VELCKAAATNLLPSKVSRRAAGDSIDALDALQTHTNGNGIPITVTQRIALVSLFCSVGQALGSLRNPPLRHLQRSGSCNDADGV